jgi:hypothetical protein
MEWSPFPDEIILEHRTHSRMGNSRYKGPTPRPLGPLTETSLTSAPNLPDGAPRSPASFKTFGDYAKRVRSRSAKWTRIISAGTSTKGPTTAANATSD